LLLRQAPALIAAGGFTAVTANPAVAWIAFEAAFVAALQAECSIALAVIVAFVDGCDPSVESEAGMWTRV